jgi:penicillin-binding protein 1A
VRKGLVEYDRRHGWRGAEAHVDLPAARTAPRARDCAVPVHLRHAAAIVTAGRRRQRTGVLRDGNAVQLEAGSSKWTGRTPAALLKRGDVVRLQAGTGRRRRPFELTQIPKAEAALVSLRPRTAALRRWSAA